MGNIPGRLLQLALVVAMGGIIGCPMVPGPGPAPQAGLPELEVFPSGFSFDSGLTQDFFTISNNGGGTLNWTIINAESWMSFSSTQGSATPSDPSEVTITVDPSVLSTTKQGSEILGTFTVSSSVGSVEVPVALRSGGGIVTDDPSIQLSTTALDFGTTFTSRTFSLRNGGPGAFDYTIAIPGGSFITSVNPASGSASGVSQQITVTVNRDTLAPGTYTSTLTIDAGAVGTATVDVSVTVGDVSPVLTLNPTSLDFGISTNALAFNIINGGGGALAWTAASDQPFVTLSTTNGSAAAGETNGVTVNVDRSTLAVGTHTATITVTSGALSETVSVTLEVADAVLTVTPSVLSFGNAATTRLITISNPGVGTLNWSITNITQPWITVTPPNGSVTTEADAVFVEIDRSMIPPGVFNESFQVVSPDDPTNSPVTVTLTGVFLNPMVEIDSGILDTATNLPLTNGNGEPVVELGTNLDTATFTIRNTGNGFLNWNVDNGATPDWLLISPISGTLGEGQEEIVTVRVDRDGAAGAYFFEMPVVTNAGTINVEIGMTVSGRITIISSSSQINLGLFDNVTSFDIANGGDPDTVLNFVVENDREWLFHSPPTGFSIGVSTPVPFKDWRTIDVSIDRGELDGTGGTGVFEIYAVDDEGERITTIDPAQVIISVEASPLTFEQPLAQLRIPSITRFTFNMRDIQYNTFDIDASTIPVSNFQVFENNVALEILETNQFIDNAIIGGGLNNTGRGKVRENILVLFDFSGSTAAAAANLGQSLQDIYVDFLTEFVNNLSSGINVGLAEFHDRGQPIAVLAPFTQDLPSLVATLAGPLPILDNGSTNLFTNLLTANSLVLGADGFSAQNATAQVTGIVVVSDGRATTPPGEISELIDITRGQRIRYFTVPFGEDVNNQVLSQLATATGGHHYNTRPQADGRADTDALEDVMAELAIDLQRFVVFNYLTLSEENGTTVRVNASVDIPNDGRTAVGGTFEQTLSFEDIMGDVRLGQVSLESSPQPNGDVVVRVRADYLPANLDKFNFVFDATGACDGNPGGLTFTVSQVPTAEGGVIGDWIPDAGNPAGAVSSGTYRFDAPGGTVARYGDFGDMLELTFPAGTPTPFTLCFTVDNTIYVGDIDQKYFIAPEAIRVLGSLSFAPSFPAPRFDADASTEALEGVRVIGAIDATVDFLIANIGGSFQDNDLFYEFTDVPSFLELNNGLSGAFGEPAGSILDPDIIFFDVNRDGDAGSFEEFVEITWRGDPGDGTGLNIGGQSFIIVTATIDPPELAVSTNTIDFGNAGDVQEDLIVSNIGQSTLIWSIFGLDTAPAGFSVSPDSDAVSASSPNDTVSVMLDRNVAATGSYDFNLEVRGDNGDVEIINILAEVANPVLTVDQAILDFGTAANTLTLAIQNTGESTLQWAIDNSGFPSWLSVSVLGGTTQDETDTLGVIVNRGGLAAGTFSHTFDITSNGGTVSVQVDMEVL